MTRTPAKTTHRKVSPAARQTAGLAPIAQFDEVLALIEAARRRAYQAVNTELVGLYWQLGEYISKKIATAEWGDGVVDELAAAIAREYPGMPRRPCANWGRLAPPRTGALPGARGP